MYWSLNVSPHGQCWVEGEDVESALATVREHYGKSATAECDYGADERPLSAKKLPEGRCYLAEDATWRQGDGAPMLSREANLLMAFGASYQEAVQYQIAIQSGDPEGRKAVTDAVDARNKIAARARDMERAIQKARQLGEKQRASGRSAASGLSDWDMGDLLRDTTLGDTTTPEERQRINAAYSGAEKAGGGE